MATFKFDKEENFQSTILNVSIASDLSARQKFGRKAKWVTKQEESLLAHFGFQCNYRPLGHRL